jgi:hypothetical protein
MRKFNWSPYGEGKARTRRATGQLGEAWLAALIIGSFLVCNGASAEVISGTQISFAFNNSLGDYEADVIQTPSALQSPPGNGTSVFFSYSGTTIGFANITLDEGSDWFLVNAGDVFSADTIAAHQFPAIIEAGFPVGGPVSIPLGNFYLGMTTGLGFTNGQPNRNVFGWLELNNTGSELLPVASAVDYGDGGIIVGTTTPAPEPATLALVSVAPLVLVRNRRKDR